MSLKNPNALVGSVSAFGGGEAVVNVARLFGWDLSTGWGLGIAAAATYTVLFVGKNGFVGVWRVLKFGTNGGTPAVPKP